MNITVLGKTLVGFAVGVPLIVAAVFIRDVVLWRPRHIAEFEVPVALTKLELQDASSRPLWRIESNQRRPVAYLDYGKTPPGYAQTFPTNSAPRPLRTGERVRLVYVTSDGYYKQHNGTIVGTSAFAGGTWQGGSLKGIDERSVFAPPN